MIALNNRPASGGRGLTPEQIHNLMSITSSLEETKRILSDLKWADKRDFEFADNFELVLSLAFKWWNQIRFEKELS